MWLGSIAHSPSFPLSPSAKGGGARGWPHRAKLAPRVSASLSLNDCYSKGYVNQVLVQSTTLFEFYYTKGDIDTLLADKVSATGNVSLPGHLDIGATYTSSRTRCNAELGGYAGYAELNLRVVTICV